MMEPSGARHQECSSCKHPCAGRPATSAAQLDFSPQARHGLADTRTGSTNPNCAFASHCHGTSSSQQHQTAHHKYEYQISCPQTLHHTSTRDSHRAVASHRRQRGKHSRILWFLAVLYLVPGNVRAQGFWKNASPLDLPAGQGSVSIHGAGLSPGVSDYVCSFRTNIVNPFRGEFEARTSSLSVTSATDATCPVPAWDLPATAVVLEIYKADVLLTKQVSDNCTRREPGVSRRARGGGHTLPRATRGTSARDTSGLKNAPLKSYWSVWVIDSNFF